MSDTLLPCPFCGGEATLRCDGGDNGPISDDWYDWYVKCTNMVCRAEISYQMPKADAIAAWNSRAPATIPPDVRETLRGALQLSGGYLSGDIPPYSSKWGLTDIDAALSWLDAQGE